MLTQSINVAKLIGMAESEVTERLQAALKEMVNTVNSDPQNSMAVMYSKYGQPCDDLLEDAPRRFADLIAREDKGF